MSLVTHKSSLRIADLLQRIDRLEGDSFRMRNQYTPVPNRESNLEGCLRTNRSESSQYCPLRGYYSNLDLRCKDLAHNCFANETPCIVRFRRSYRPLSGY